MKFVVIACLIGILSACARYPTERTQVVDDRPRLAFDVAALEQPVERYELHIDGISYGTIDQYLVDENALRVLDGRHLLQVYRAGKPVFEREVVLGPNTTRVVKILEFE